MIVAVMVVYIMFGGIHGGHIIKVEAHAYQVTSGHPFSKCFQAFFKQVSVVHKHFMCLTFQGI